MSPRLLAQSAAALGAAALAITVMLGLMEPLLAGRCARAFSTFTFQLGGFAAADELLMSLCGLERTLALSWINRLDLLFLIPIYTAFLVLAARVFAGAWTSKRALAAIAFALAAAAADVIETSTQLRVTGWASLHHGADFEPMRAAMETVLTAARFKFAFLAAHAASLAFIAFVKQPPLRFIGGACLAPIMGVSAVVDDPARAPLAALTFALGWGAAIFYAFRLARAPDAPPQVQTPAGAPPRSPDDSRASHVQDT